ncbi:class I adenylate-forming enzyme family protein [Streptomyces sp. SH5]|uniref:AMP-binding protein n=1 Tax=Streptomyces sindenensis TaxID=67363 RepID=A0ABW6EQM7_9ACTN|nr:class I adenylate-forming enzyme family protein [Streptomyces sp. SH5]WGP08190.1 class I adenylate-forming enzyme family protein [Streptomyces sp. SH5]
MSNLATALVETAQRYPQDLAVQGAGRFLTYAELDEFSARAAGGLLAHGVVPGDRVGLRLPSSPAFTVLFFGALRTGAITVPLSPMGRSLAVPPRHDACGTRLVFTAPDPATAQEARGGDTTLVPVGSDFLDQMTFWPQHTSVTDRGDHDPAAMVRTEGTARSALSITFSHRALREAALTARAPVGGTAMNNERLCASFPSAGPAYGLTALMQSGACLSARGGRAAVSPGRRGEIAALCLATGPGERR